MHVFIVCLYSHGVFDMYFMQGKEKMRDEQGEAFVVIFAYIQGENANEENTTMVCIRCIVSISDIKVVE